MDEHQMVWNEKVAEKLIGNLHRKDERLFSVRSLTPPQAARNALAFADELPSRKQRGINKGCNQFYRRTRRGIRPSASQ